jgi:hypothetical protein
MDSQQFALGILVCSDPAHPSIHSTLPSCDNQDAELFVEFGVNLSGDVKLSVRRVQEGHQEHLFLEEDPDGTTFDVLQAGCGFYKGTKEHCPRVSKLVVKLRPPVSEDNRVAQAFLAVGTLIVDIDAQSVASAPNFEPVPCTDAVCVWRHFKDVVSPVPGAPGAFEATTVVDGQLPFRRIGMAVMHTSQLTIPQRQLLQQVSPRLPH